MHYWSVSPESCPMFLKWHEWVYEVECFFVKNPPIGLGNCDWSQIPILFWDYYQPDISQTSGYATVEYVLVITVPVVLHIFLIRKDVADLLVGGLRLTSCLPKWKPYNCSFYWPFFYFYTWTLLYTHICYGFFIVFRSLRGIGGFGKDLYGRIFYLFIRVLCFHNVDRVVFLVLICVILILAPCPSFLSNL